MTKDEKIAKLQEVELKQELYDEQYNEDLKAGLDLLDDEWFIASLNGKFRVINKKNIFIQMTDSDAENTFSDLYVSRKTAGIKEDAESIEGVYQKWKMSAKRYMGLEFDPSKQYGEVKNKFNHSVWNTWKGWEIKEEKNGKASGFLSHIYYNICQRNKELYNVIIDSWATIIQTPWKHYPKIFAMKGLEGAGKSFMVENFMKLLGDYSATLSNSMVESNFNALFFQKVFTFADESCWVGDKRTQNKLKNISGNDTLPIEFKGKDAFITKNYCHLWVSTNEKWVAPKNDNSRRYITWTVGSRHLNDTKYFERIKNELENGGYEDLMYYLKNRIITTNLWAKLPDYDLETSREQELFTMESEDPVKLWLIQCQELEVDSLCNPIVLKGKYLSREVYPWYVEWSKWANMYKTENFYMFSKSLTKFVDIYSKSHNVTKWDFSNWKNL